MKNFKRTLAAMLTAATMLTPCIAATTMNVSAAGDINITNAEADHTYTAYQVFQGTISDSSIGNAQWGTNVNGDAIITALKASTAFGATNPFGSVASAQNVVDALGSRTFTATELDAFATIVEANLTGSGTAAVNGLIDDAADGYYLIVDSGKSGEPTARYMLQVSGKDVDVANKTSAFPTLDKTFADGSTSNTASIGDTIEYKLTSTVPNMTGYNKYFFIVNDTLDTGLTLNADSFEVVIGTKTLVKDTDYYIEVTDADNSTVGGQSFKLVFMNFIQHKADQAIEITYSATLNEDANLGTGANDGNENTANLTYSNNPNFEYQGDDNGTDDTTDDKPDEPGSSGETDNPDTPDVDESKEPTGGTPDEVVVTYSTKLQIDKVDENNKPLEGAGFTLYEGSEVAGDPLGTFTLVDGSSTQFEFEGLGEGTYTIVESTTPGGYNTIAPITFTISATTDLDSVTWTADKTFAFDGETAEFEATIQNNKGSQLPETGGIGTTIFYIVGGLLVVGSSVVLITKKRMSAEK